MLEVIAVPDTRFNFKTPGLFRFLASLLIFALASPPSGYAQQPQTSQPRILTQEGTKTNTAKPSGPRAARPELVLQTGVTTPAYNAVFSPDGRLLALMDWMAVSIKLWEIESGRELLAINLGARTAITQAINSAFAFSSDGSSLFSVSAGTLQQWETRTGRQLRVTDLNQGKDFGFVYFSADARLLATTTGRRYSLAVWDVASGRKLQEFRLDGNDLEQLRAFALSPDGRTLATNIESNKEGVDLDTLTLRDAASGRVTQTIKISEHKKTAAIVTRGVATSSVRVIRFRPDGRAVAVAFHDTTSENPQFLTGGRSRVTGRENKIRMWDVADGRELIAFDAGAQGSEVSDSPLSWGMTNTLAFSNDNRQCAFASGNTVKLIDPAARRDLATIGGHNGEVVAVSFSADGKLLATISLDSTIKIWDVSAAATTGRVELARNLSGMAIPVESAAFDADGRALAVSGANTVSVWELNTGAALRTITIPAVTRGANVLAKPPPSVFSPGGRLFASQSGANEIKLWETRTGREVKSFPLSQGKKFDGGDVSPDGRWVALAERQSDSKSTSGTANRSGGADSSTQPGALKSAQGFTQPPPPMIPTAPTDSTGNSKKDEKARKKSDKEQMKERIKMAQEIIKATEEQMKELNKQMGGGKKMDRKQMEKRAEQTRQNNEEMEKAMQSGDIGKAMEMMGKIAQADPLNAAMTQPQVNIKLWDVNAASEARSLPGKPVFQGSNLGSAFTFNNDGSLLASATGGP